MKKNIIFNSVHFANVGKPAREPLRTLEEMADEFGLTHGQLRAMLRNDGAPKPELQNQNKNTQKRNWYKPSVMRAWFKALPQ
jgi:hypothetical protein